MPILAALLVVAAWRGLGVQLRQDGVHVRYVLGFLIVPWEAMPAGHTHRPADQPPTLRLGYARPELVQRRGRAPAGTLPTDSIDAQFLADAIRHYALHPEHRAAIGTEREHQRLHEALTDR
ncbi:hypothetical protein ONA91_40235 [Micromonospora sp. DR5-3]|uniref:hypothetical protein n=1 Tax=unclassified Micromonospora TaxID=2617518 RepID=UPI0011D82F02|nr:MULTISPECIES: hypothetical protein [unclassified Micromonospora]MCW3820673.1 hypothetical protein [Micromonospora sp. DR5-3]TYC19031.1 hypothetical protein FXF52_38855 [Micromonospora sp. MP36]